MNLQSLRVFMTAAYADSLSAAADELLYAPSTVTMHIRQLEAEWGVTLFEKDGRSVKLTSDGVALLAKVKSILEQVDLLQHNVREMEKGTAGHLNFAAIEPVGSWRIAPLLAEFARTRPLLQINMESGSKYSIGNRVRDGHIDLGIMQDPNPGCLLPFEPLYIEKMRLLIRDDHPLAKEDMVSIEQLRNERLIFTETIVSYRTVIQHGLTYYRGNNPYAGIEINSIQAATTFVQKGIGIAILPEICVSPPPPNTVVRPIVESDFEMTIGLVHRDIDKPKPKVLEDFIELLRCNLRTIEPLL